MFLYKVMLSAEVCCCICCINACSCSGHCKQSLQGPPLINVQHSVLLSAACGERCVGITQCAAVIACPGAGTQQGGILCFDSVIATCVEQRRRQAGQQPRLQDLVLCCQLYILMQPSSAVCITSGHMYLFEGSSAWTVQHAAALLLFSTRANAESACAYSPGDAVWWHTDRSNWGSMCAAAPSWCQAQVT